MDYDQEVSATPLLLQLWWPDPEYGFILIAAIVKPRKSQATEEDAVALNQHNQTLTELLGSLVSFFMSPKPEGKGSGQQTGVGSKRVQNTGVQGYVVVMAAPLVPVLIDCRADCAPTVCAGPMPDAVNLSCMVSITQALSLPFQCFSLEGCAGGLRISGFPSSFVIGEEDWEMRLWTRQQFLSSLEKHVLAAFPVAAPSIRLPAQIVQHCVDLLGKGGVRDHCTKQEGATESALLGHNGRSPEGYLAFQENRVEHEFESSHDTDGQAEGKGSGQQTGVGSKRVQNTGVQGHLVRKLVRDTFSCCAHSFLLLLCSFCLVVQTVALDPSKEACTSCCNVGDSRLAREVEVWWNLVLTVLGFLVTWLVAVYFEPRRLSKMVMVVISKLEGENEYRQVLFNSRAPVEPLATHHMPSKMATEIRIDIPSDSGSRFHGEINHTGKGKSIQMEPIHHTDASNINPSTTSSLMEGCIGNQFRLGEKITSDSFGEIYLGTHIETNEEVTIKLESRKMKHSKLLDDSSKMYWILVGGTGIPNMRFIGVEGDNNVLVFDRMGPSLEELLSICHQKFSLKTVLMLAEQLIDIVEYVHSMGFLLGNISPKNLLMGLGRRARHVYIIDFGLGQKYDNSSIDKHIPLWENKNLTGTARYASINMHLGVEQTRGDDLESLGYVLMYFLRGSLPWQKLKTRTKKQKYKKMKEMKESTPFEILCEAYPSDFAAYFQYCRSLKFNDKPKYAYLKRIFRGIFADEGFELDSPFDWTILE